MSEGLGVSAGEGREASAQMAVLMGLERGHPCRRTGDGSIHKHTDALYLPLLHCTAMYYTIQRGCLERGHPCRHTGDESIQTPMCTEPLLHYSMLQRCTELYYTSLFCTEVHCSCITGIPGRERLTAQRDPGVPLP